MSEREFTITELQRAGNGRYVDTKVKFTWTNQNYAAPRGSWKFGLEQRTVREDYPGTEEPVEQVLGPNYSPFTLMGVWDDRYGGQGFARDTWQQFEALAQRGSLCRFEFESVSIVGLIKNASFDYKRASLIGYQFEVSPHYRVPGGLTSGTTVRRKPVEGFKPVAEYRDGVNAATTNMESTFSTTPKLFMTGNTASDTKGFLDNLRSATNKLIEAVDQRLDPAVETFEALRRIAGSLAVVKGAAAGLVFHVASMKTSANLAVESAVGVLDFDVWRTDTSRYARWLILNGYQGREELNRRADPKAVALYRPHKGESLYTISQRFYATPTMWRLIATRNGLQSMTLQGTEVLIIPERR